MKTGALLTLFSTVFLAAPAVSAQAPETAVIPGPFAQWLSRGGNFGAVGQFVLSGELELSVVKRRGGSTTFTVRPALDYFIAPSVSVGGVLGLAVTSGSPTATDVIVGARAGYNLAVAERISFWPGAGLYYARSSGGAAANDATWLGVFAPFLFHPVPHLFLGFGPFVELGLGDGGDRFGLQSVVGGWI